MVYICVHVDRQNEEPSSDRKDSSWDKGAEYDHFTASLLHLTTPPSALLGVFYVCTMLLWTLMQSKTCYKVISDHLNTFTVAQLSGKGECLSHTGLVLVPTDSS